MKPASILYGFTLIVLLLQSQTAAAQLFGNSCVQQIGRFCLSDAIEEFPKTDFSKTTIDLGEIMSGGPPKDGIPPIDSPAFETLEDIDGIDPREPVVGLVHGGEWKAYPLRILMWHEIVNDSIGGMPISVTFCPLCNAVAVFDRRVEGQTLDFGTTGRLRKSDLVMWDRQTESWWQQFTGEAIIGSLTGTKLTIVPSRLESYADFTERAPQDALVLIPNGRHIRNYGGNPYAGYDSLEQPFLYEGEVPEGINALARVVSLTGKKQAWSLELLQEQERVETPDGTVLSWRPGQVSALDAPMIAESKDVGSVIATRDGKDVPYFVDFAFAFHAFHPGAPIHLPEPISDQPDPISE